MPVSDLQLEDAIRLLQTNNGHYAAACGLDYSRPHLFYDTFAMRDVDGKTVLKFGVSTPLITMKGT